MACPKTLNPSIKICKTVVKNGFDADGCPEIQVSLECKTYVPPPGPRGRPVRDWIPKT